jgi:5-methylcytosine-specific restriction endonuclease McrA
MPRQHTTNDLTYRRNRQTLLADNPPCYRCGKPADTADHIIEVDRGGTHDMDNLRPACRKCNSTTGAIYKAKRDALKIQNRNAAVNHFFDTTPPPPTPRSSDL